jgi:hypothetical protein
VCSPIRVIGFTSGIKLSAQTEGIEFIGYYILYPAAEGKGALDYVTAGTMQWSMLKDYYLRCIIKSKAKERR